MSDKNHCDHHHPHHEHEHHHEPHHEPAEPPDNLQGGPLGKWLVIGGVVLVVGAFVWGMTMGFGW